MSDAAGDGGRGLRERIARIPARWAAAALLACLVPLLAVAPAFLEPLRSANFDAWQRLFPRERTQFPVTIVAIDEAAVDRYGQWPWPRDRFAALLDAIGRAQPAAVGLDIVFTEPDQTSPEALAARLPAASPLKGALAAMPTHDDALAAALLRGAVVLGAALHNDPDMARRDARLPHAALAPMRITGTDPAPQLIRYRSAMRNLPTLEAAAAGVAALSSEPEGGVVRRVALLDRVGDAVWPALSMEMLRVAAGAPALTLRADAGGMRAVEIAGYAAPTGPDGRMWVHWAPFAASRVVSAADVLAGRANPEALHQHLVLVGFYAHGLLDVVSTPLGDRRAGVEAHAEVLENVLERRLLERPRFAALVEAGALLGLCALLIVFVPRVSALRASALLLAALAALATVGALAFVQAGWLLDVASPALATALVFAVLLTFTLTESERRRRALGLELQRQREAQARLEGELTAAQRIQLGLLPQPEQVLAGEARVDVAAFILPARSVGGDLYDFFMLDADHIFVAIGDVSGKGVPASLFMALAKSLTKSSALRDDAELAEVISRAQLEISRDNPEFMFMTLAAFVIDLRDGAMRYVNAGHETPLLVRDGAVITLDDGGGPPICVLDDFPFASAELRLQRGDRLLLMTDGVTEAQDPAGALYGRKRFDAVVDATTKRDQGATAKSLVEAIHADVLAFAAGTELPDDIALVALTWKGA